MLRIKALVSCGLMVALTGFLASPATADEQAKGGGKREELIKKFDKNGDGQLSDEEKEAAKKEFRSKGGAGNRTGGKGELMKKFDKNGDGQLDDQEREAARKELKGSPAGNRKPGAAKPGDGKPGEGDGRLLKHFDKNGDGKLDDDERAAAKAAMEKRRAEKNK